MFSRSLLHKKIYIFFFLTLATCDHLFCCAPSSQDNSRGKCLEKAPLVTCYSPNNITKLTYYSSNNTVMFTCHPSNTTASWLVISQMLPCLLVILPHVITTSLTYYSFSYTTAGLYLVIAHVLLICLFAFFFFKPLLQHVVPLRNEMLSSFSIFLQSIQWHHFLCTPVAFV